MSTGVKDVLAFVKEKRIREVDLRFTDLIGAWHHLTIPAETLTSDVFKYGVAFDSSSVPGFKGVEGGDMVLVPDPATMVIDPFYEQPTMGMICWICEADTLARFLRDPRVIAARAEDYLRATKVADASLWSPEFEFYIFDHVTSINTNNRAGYSVNAVEAHWNTGEEQEKHLGLRIPYQSGYHIMPPLDVLHDLRGRMGGHLQDAGIAVKYHHHEVGGAGQCEIEVGFFPLRAAGDMTMLAKYIIKQTARQGAHVATFMPKPLTDEAGTGMHFHQLLMKGAKPVFYAPQGHAGLSQTARYYIGGLLEHAPSLLAITNPSTNSYKRLVPGYEAPTRAFYGLANRSAAVRIPRQATKPEEKRLEFRSPDGTCNPYLAMTAQLLAGLDGIKRKLEPSEHGFGPYDCSVMDLPEAVRESIKSLPNTLADALKALEQDHDYLLPGRVFPEEFVPVWIEYKQQHDVRPIMVRTHPYEIDLYFDS